MFHLVIEWGGEVYDDADFLFFGVKCGADLLDKSAGAGVDLFSLPEGGGGDFEINPGRSAAEYLQFRDQRLGKIQGQNIFVGC